MAAPRITITQRNAAWSEALARPEALVRRAVGAVLGDRRVGIRRTAEVGVILADDPFVRRLNRDHRGKDKPTNVLSFPLAEPTPRLRASRACGTDNAPLLLGDVVLALRTIRREARAEGKAFHHHAAHLLVHGTLHLLGFDHERLADAREMEDHEVRILARLGIPDPYRFAAEGRAA